MNAALAGAIFMFLGVALGAFGAHGLKSRLTADLLQIFETGVRYQIYHAVGLFVVAWLAEKSSSNLLSAAGWTFVGGIFLFSGSLYLYALTGFKPLVMITPVGGLLFLVGWALVAFASFH